MSGHWYKDKACVKRSYTILYTIASLFKIIVHDQYPLPMFPPYTAPTQYRIIYDMTYSNYLQHEKNSIPGTIIYITNYNTHTCSVVGDLEIHIIYLLDDTFWFHKFYSINQSIRCHKYLYISELCYLQRCIHNTYIYIGLIVSVVG